jgi:hypothetical protein
MRRIIAQIAAAASLPRCGAVWSSLRFGGIGIFLALAVTDAMGLKQNDTTVGYLLDLIAEVQIVPSGIIAAAHLAAGGISLSKVR